MVTSKFHGHPFCTLPAKLALKTEDHNSLGGGSGRDGGSGHGPHLERNETFLTFPQKCT